MVGEFSKGNGTLKISGKSRLVKYYFIWPDYIPENEPLVNY